LSLSYPSGERKNLSPLPSSPAARYRWETGVSGLSGGFEVDFCFFSLPVSRGCRAASSRRWRGSQPDLRVESLPGPTFLRISDIREGIRGQLTGDSRAACVFEIQSGIPPIRSTDRRAVQMFGTQSRTPLIESADRWAARPEAGLAGHAELFFRFLSPFEVRRRGGRSSFRRAALAPARLFACLNPTAQQSRPNG